MNKETVSDAIDLLLKLFYDDENKNEYLSMKAMELFFEVGIFDTPSVVANVIEEQRAFALLNKMNLFDAEFVLDLEDLLKGY